jgi:UDP-GlcNAc:undecaprenyl-phosphate GlcNAc-1-phosphate transferase
VGLGLVDDLFGLAPRVKLGGQIVAAVLIGRGGLVIDRVTVPLSWVGIDLGAFALPLTVVWIVVVANSLNLIDGLDGLAGGTTAVVAVAYAILGILADSGIMVLVSLALLGSVVGFLFFNYPPARIFMGDSGSLLLGTLLAIIPFVPTPTTAPWQPVALAVSMMCLLVPLMDTVIAVVRRLLNRCAIHVADRNHIHHVLLAVGFSPKQVLLVFCLGTGVAAAVALSFGFVHPAAAFTLFLVVCVSAATGVFVLYRVKARAVSMETV